MKVISNATPLIILSRIERLNILQSLYKQIIVPLEVCRELVEAGGDKPGAKQIKGSSWIKIEGVRDTLAVKVLRGNMDKGEAEAIVLAMENPGSLLLIDNKRPYEKAKVIGINARRTLSIMIEAYKKGFISNFADALKDVRERGFYIDEKTYGDILKVVR